MKKNIKHFLIGIVLTASALSLPGCSEEEVAISAIAGLSGLLVGKAISDADYAEQQRFELACRRPRQHCETRSTPWGNDTTCVRYVPEGCIAADSDVVNVPVAPEFVARSFHIPLSTAEKLLILVSIGKTSDSAARTAVEQMGLRTRDLVWAYQDFSGNRLISPRIINPLSKYLQMSRADTIALVLKLQAQAIKQYKVERPLTEPYVDSRSI